MRALVATTDAAVAQSLSRIAQSRADATFDEDNGIDDNPSIAHAIDGSYASNANAAVDNSSSNFLTTVQQQLQSQGSGSELLPSPSRRSSNIEGLSKLKPPSFRAINTSAKASHSTNNTRLTLTDFTFKR